MSFGATKRIHFVGIGGAGMSGIAEVLLTMGYEVSGSDILASDLTRELSGKGAEISIPHRAENVDRADVVVVSSAIGSDNVELKAARSKMTPIITRARMLAELMRLKFSIAVAGAHGKTTVTSMISLALTGGGLDPTIIIGGRLGKLGGGARLGSSEYLVAEADESDGSFLDLYPTIAVVTNIDHEHMDHYGSFDELKSAFARFINKTPFYGVGVICLDDENLQELIPSIEKRFVSYGINSSADYIARDIEFDRLESSFEASARGVSIGRVRIGMPGEHNVRNALAAIAVADELKIDRERIIAALDRFSGVARRSDVKGSARGALVMDDYGHHPTEIRATLRALKVGFPQRRLLVVFQPHRYSRTALLMDQFHKSFYDADMLYLTDIYAAGEKPIDGASATLIASGARSHGHKSVFYAASFKEILGELLDQTRAGDIVLFLGAGSITQLSATFLSELEKLDDRGSDEEAE